MDNTPKQARKPVVILSTLLLGIVTGLGTAYWMVSARSDPNRALPGARAATVKDESTQGRDRAPDATPSQVLLNPVVTTDPLSPPVLAVPKKPDPILRSDVIKMTPDGRFPGLEVEEEQWKKNLRARLKKSIGPFDFSHISVPAIVEDLSRTSGIDMRIDPKVEQDLSQIQIPKFRDATGVRSMEMVLNQLNGEILEDYRWTLKNGGVFISTKYGVLDEIVSRVIDVRQIVERGVLMYEIKEMLEAHIPEILESQGEVRALENAKLISIRCHPEHLGKVSEILGAIYTAR